MAAQPNVVTSQHWELLAESASGLVAAKTFSIRRGDLPGGTDAFDPAPTASFEVAGHISNAGSTSQGYDVALKDSLGSPIAPTVEFRGSNNNSTYITKFVSFPWPSADRQLSKIEVTPIGLTPGIFGLKKAYVKLRQAGTIMKSVGRVPLGTRQTQTTESDWSQIKDPFIYEHQSSDFNPAPSIKLRATAQQYVCGTFHVSLRDDTAPTNPVAGSELSFSSLSSAETGTLTLVDAHTYRVQTRVDLDGCDDQGHQRSNEIEPTVPTGDLVNADLVLSQSTTNADGIELAVGWYPSVTAASDVTQDNQRLQFRLRAPHIAAPNPVSAQWLTTAKRTGPVGSIGGRLRNLDENQVIAAAANAVDPEYQTLASASSIALPAANALMDTETQVLGNAVGGRISSTVLRVVQDLWDDSNPEVILDTAVIGGFDAFGPLGNTTRKTLTFRTRVRDFSPLSWKFEVRNDAGQIVRSSPTTSGFDARIQQWIQWEWNGRDDADGPLQEGTYYVRAHVADLQGNYSLSPPSPDGAGQPVHGIPVKVDNTAPVVTSLVVESGYVGSAPERFAPAVLPTAYMTLRP